MSNMNDIRNEDDIEFETFPHDKNEDNELYHYTTVQQDVKTYDGDGDGDEDQESFLHANREYFDSNNNTDTMDTNSSTNECDDINDDRLSIASSVGLLILLLFIGSLGFWLIEGRAERERQRENDVHHDDFEVTATEWKKLKTWTWFNSLYFSTISITTVGYGDMSPVTTLGRVFLFFYTLFGLAFVAYFFSAVGEAAVNRAARKYQHSRGIIIFIIRRCFPASNDRRIGIYSRLLGIGLPLLALFFLGALWFHKFEDWSYGGSLYFCWITLTTIGYGDLAPKTDGGRIGAMGLILFGLGVAGMMVNEVGEFVTRNAKRMQRFRRRMKRKFRQWCYYCFCCCFCFPRNKRSNS